ncbi:MAG: efflux transporter outer membrane subunit [Acidiferrobacteraceae bacterium]
MKPCAYRLLPALLGATLTACAIPQRLTPAPTPRPLPSISDNARAALKTHVATGAPWPSRQWWRMFKDPALDGLVRQALHNNPDMALAAARLDIARTNVERAKAELGTSFALNGGANRQHLSTNGLFPPPIGGETVTEEQLSIDAHREIDWWHRDRDLIQAALSSEQAQRAQNAQGRLLLEKALITAYFRFGRDERQLALLRTLYRHDQSLLRIAQTALSAGATSAMPVVRAETGLAKAREEVLSYQARSRLDRIALAALVGHGPAWAHHLKAPAAYYPSPVPLPRHLALDLLARRPDVVVRYWLLRAAAARVHAAKAGFYPNISLTATAGLDTLTLAKLLEPSSLMASAGAAIHLPLFMPGALKANLGRARSQYDAAVDQYNHTVINAAREVGEQLTTLRALNRELSAQHRVIDAQTQELRIVQTRYQAGSAGIAVLFRSENRWIESRLEATVLDARRLQAVAGLVEALGGGYQTHGMRI